MLDTKYLIVCNSLIAIAVNGYTQSKSAINIHYDVIYFYNIIFLTLKISIDYK